MNERKTFQKYKNLKIYKNRKNIKNSFKTNKGITLIALVISIIVMLILAGVSLNAVIRRQWNNYTSTKCNLCTECSSIRGIFEPILCFSL